MTYTIARNPDYNSLEITFDGIPSEQIRTALKTLRFRWHKLRRVWYGYADEKTVEDAITGADVQPAKASEAGQDHIRIYWNGIKIDGGKLIRCGYSIDNNIDHSECVSIYARDYDNLPRDLLPVENESDIYTDYFENDRAHLTPEHPLYRYFRYAGMKDAARMAKKEIERLQKELKEPERWSDQHDFYRKEIERHKNTIKTFEVATDPGQPTTADLAAIDRARQEAENARKAAELEEEQRERENARNMRVNGRRLIEAEAAAHPIRDGAPVVLINWSEHPAFYAYGEDSLRLSIAAADNVFRVLGEEVKQNDGCFKTKFTITSDFQPVATYIGRYDLGSDAGGLVEYIRSIGEYYRTHDQNGHTLETPEEENELNRFADFLAKWKE